MYRERDIDMSALRRDLMATARVPRLGALRTWQVALALEALSHPCIYIYIYTIH